jgi:uncharacterized protein YjbI with pentapeptide repeats
MANRQHSEVLRERMNAKGILVKKHQQECLDLRGIDLNGADLRELNLSRADLTDANLAGANLAGADLSDTILTRANFFRANLTRASLSQANLHRGDLASATLDDANLFNADLSDANLSKAALCNTTLFAADLQRANLQKANLTNANLLDAILDDANLGAAVLNWANFSRARLRNVSFLSADLTGATLNGAVLEGAQFENCFFGRTVFGDVDLSATLGLETAQHRGRSSLGVDTVMRSGGNIPEEFLRGCGIPEEMVARFPSFIAAALRHHHCFITFVPADVEFAKQLHARLHSKGIRCWLNPLSLSTTTDVPNVFDNEVRDGDKILLCISKRMLLDKRGRNSLQQIFHQARAESEAGRRINSQPLLLNLDDFILSDEFQNEFSNSVPSFSVLDFTNIQADTVRFDASASQLVRQLQVVNIHSQINPELPKEQSRFEWRE